MPASDKQDTHGKPQATLYQPSKETTVSNAPSSPGDSPKRVTPKDVTPEHASYRDLKVSDVGSDRHGGAQADEAGPRGAGSDTGADDDLPSSPGDSPRETTPKDVSPEHASYADATRRDIAGAAGEDHDEALADEASELSFPASDPPAKTAAADATSAGANQPQDEEEDLIDEAVELTFPASDPIAVKSISRIDPGNPASR